MAAGSVTAARGGRVQPVGQRDQPLRNAVVDIAGQPATLELLRLDDLLDEILVRAFADHQLAMQPGLVQRPGDQPADHEQQLHVARRELPLLRRCAR